MRSESMIFGARRPQQVQRLCFEFDVVAVSGELEGPGDLTSKLGGGDGIPE